MFANEFAPYLPILEKALKRLDRWRSSFDLEKAVRNVGEGSGTANIEPERLEDAVLEFTRRLEGNYPFHHPLYAGQMLKPPHPVAWLAWTLAMTINPNNHALDGGPPTSEMEKEVVAKLARMAGYGESFLGHLTSGGTVANLEALWIGRELHPGKAVASTGQAHYTHERMSRVLGIPHITVPVDAEGNPDLEFLDAKADEIGTLVVTLGTTGLGRVEPLDRLLPWAREREIRVHVDAAYGGFYKLLAGREGIRSDPWELIGEADSIVIDPHKHGLQPYGCGSVLFKDPDVGRFYKHDSPYTYFTSDDLHLGEITLECSRAGASAAGLWLTLELLPLKGGADRADGAPAEDFEADRREGHGGDSGAGNDNKDVESGAEGPGRSGGAGEPAGLVGVLLECRRAAMALHAELTESESYRPYTEPELDIVTYFPVPGEKKTSGVSRLSRQVMQRGMNDPESRLYLSLCSVSADHFCRLHPEYESDGEQVAILRSVLMKPEHHSFAGEILERLEALAGKAV